MPASSEVTADNYANGRKESGMHSAEDIASAVWKFLEAAGSLAAQWEKDDDVKLLRLRTKKNELVIVPGTFDSFPNSTLLIEGKTSNMFSSLYTIHRPPKRQVSEVLSIRVHHCPSSVMIPTDLEQQYINHQ